MLKIKDVLEMPDYAFVKELPLVFATLGGSHAYGLATETSDIDVRAVVFEQPEELFGLEQAKTIAMETPDVTIYPLRKFVSLATQANPNILEMLYCRSESVYVPTLAWCELIAKRNVFLSRKMKDSFCGYAKQQLVRMQNALKEKKYDERLDKHAMHLLRLYITGTQILQGYPAPTYIETYRDFLLEVRYGKYRTKNQEYADDFYLHAEFWKRKFLTTLESADLPYETDRHKINNMLVDIYSKYYKKES